MSRKQKNETLAEARRIRDDEFYTKIEDVANAFGRPEFKAKVKGREIYCPCDSEESAFYRYFKDNFDELGLKSLTARSWSQEYLGPLFGGKPGEIIEFDGKKETRRGADGAGDFADEESLMIAKGKLVITNPPFSKIKAKIRFFDENDFICVMPMVRVAMLDRAAKGKWQLSGLDLRGHPMAFDKPDGSEKKVLAVWANNQGLSVCDRAHPKRREWTDEEWEKLPTFEGYRLLSSLNDAPSNRSGKIALPITAIYWDDLKGFERLLRPDHDTSDGRKYFCRLGYEWEAGR